MANRKDMRKIPAPTRKDLAILIGALALTAGVILYGLRWRFADQFGLDGSKETAESAAPMKAAPADARRGAAPSAVLTRPAANAPGEAAQRVVGSPRADAGNGKQKSVPTYYSEAAASELGYRCIGGIPYRTRISEDGSTVIEPMPAMRCR